MCDSRWGQKKALVVCRQSEFGERGKCISYTAIYVVAGSLWGSYDVYSYGELLILNCRSHILYWRLLVVVADSGVYVARYDGLLIQPYSRFCEEAVLELLRHFPILKPAVFYVGTTYTCEYSV